MVPAKRPFVSIVVGRIHALGVNSARIMGIESDHRTLARVVVNPPLPAGVEAKAFAITIEPEQGSTTPTMPIVMMGSGG